jgi:hypothetical protein
MTFARALLKLTVPVSKVKIDNVLAQLWAICDPSPFETRLSLMLIQA